MRVGIDVTSWANPREYGRYTRNLTRALVVAGSPHSFVLVADNHTAEGGGLPGDRLPENVEKIVVQTKEPVGLVLEKDGRRSVGDIWAMTNGVRGQDFDIFFFPTLHTYFPLLNGCKKVVAIHDVLAEKYPDLMISDPGQRRFWKLKSWLARRQADRIVTVSEYSKGQIAARFKLEPEMIWVVNQAVDTQFNPAPYTASLTQTLHRFSFDCTSRFITYLGGLAPHKNLDTLLKIFADISSQTAFLNVRLVLIGPEETDVLPGGVTLGQRVDELGIRNVVTITGYLPDSEVVHLMTAATLMVLPSIEEGYGLGAVEAAACGTAVIATKNSPLPDLLGEAGVFVDTTNAAEMKAAIVELLSKDELRIQMGQTALEKASGFTWKKSAGQFLELVETLAQAGEIARARAQRQ